MQKEILNYFYNFHIKEFFLELISPAFCVVCGKKLYDSNFVCKECQNKIKFIEYPLILHEEMIYYYGMTKYEGIMEELIRSYKFNGIKVLSKYFAKMLSYFTDKYEIKYDFIGYVPMSKNELKNRGYNQTYLIAKELSNLSQKPIIKNLYKIKETKKQTQLSKKEREENLRDAFKISGHYNGNVLVVDDVYTTGSTAREVTKVVKSVTEKNVYFVAITQKFN